MKTIGWFQLIQIYPEENLPSRELTHPLPPGTFESMIFFLATQPMG